MEETMNEEVMEEEKDYKALYEEEHNKYLYLLADFKNFQRKAEERILAIRESSNDDVILDFVHIYDVYAYGYEHYQNHDEAEVLINELKRVLKTYEVELYGEIGDQFDESLHSAVMTENSHDLPSKSITKIVKKGVRMNDRILRYAEVIVNE